MKKRGNYQYYVEGEDEKCILEVLKRDLGCIASGKVDKFNVIQKRFTVARIRPLKQGTIVVLVYDTDVENTEILRQNIDFLRKQSGIGGVICIPQVKSLEDELLAACQIKSIEELTHSKAKTNFKRDLINCTNLAERLRKCKFDIKRIWNCAPANKFQEFGNDADKIKL